MNCRPYSTPNPRRTWGWLKAGLFSAAVALFGSAQAQVDVTATAGTLSQSYTTMQAAFNAVNLGTHQGVITIGLSGNTTETASAVLNSGAVAPAAWTSMSITPTGSARIIEGSIAGAVVKLNGADNVTIDGRIAGSGRNLTIRNNSTASTTAAVWLASVAALNGCTGNTVRNCEIACGATQNTSTSTTWGIIMNGTTISNTSNGVDHANNTFQENRIIRCRSGIVTRGTAAGPRNQNIQVIDNIIGPTSFGADQIGVLGIGMQADDNSTVRGNTVQYVGGPFANTTAGADRVGIGIGNIAWSSTTTTTLTSTGYTVTRNLIHDIIEERTFSAAGMLLGTTNGGLATNNIVCSNMIYNVKANGTAGDAVVGIGISGGHTDQVVYNSIRMTGDVDPDPLATATSVFGAGIRITNIAATHTNLTLKNNIVYLDLFSSSAPAVRYYCASGTAAAYTWGTGGANNNDYYYNTGNTQCQTGGLATVSGGTATTQFLTLANWQTAYTNPGAQDGASIQADPGFLSATDLHINLGSTAVNNVGTTSGVTCAIDYDNDARSGTPDIGADEYSPLVCAGAAGGTISPATASGCSGTTKTMSTTGSEVGAGVTYQWEISATGGGIGFSDVVGGTGATTVSYTTAALTVGTYYYRLRVTCSNGPVTGYSNELTLTVNPTPTASAGSNSPVCVGSPLNLTGTTDIGTSYSWTGPLSYSNATQSPTVSASATLAMAGSYIFTATLNGCASAPSVTSVQVVASPLLTSTTATPNPTCFNGNSQLQVNESTAFKVSSGSLDPMAGAATLLTTGNDDTPTAASSPIGFSFIFNGTPYTDFSVSPDGWIKLGAAAAVGEFTNVLTSVTNIPRIAPYWDDMATGTTGNVRSVVTGIAPNRILKVQWFVTIPRNTVGPANSTFQAWLYENGGQIDFRYGAMGPGAMSASVGTTTSATVFRSVTISSGTLSTVTANNANAGQPGSGLSYSFDFPLSSYLWSPGTFLSSTTIANPLATLVNAASTAYTVTATNADNCTAIGTVTLTTTAPITAATITGNLGFCTGLSTTLTAVPTDGAGPYTYLWAPGGQTTAAINVTVAGTYSAQVTDACGGSVNTGNVSVVENALPIVAVAPTSSNYCTGSPAIALSASGASTYAWLPAAGLDATNVANVNASPSATTTYTVTGTDGNGCINTATSAITVLGATPVILSTTSVSPICPGSTSQLQVNLAGPSAYCTASATTTSCAGDEFLSNVTFGTINNNSGCTYGTPNFSYNDFTAQSNPVTAGSALSISATISSFFSGDQLAAFCDWNQDGDFLDVDESFLLGSTVAGVNTWPVNVPVGALNGTTRMRVRLNFNAAPPACGTTAFGEVEDYTLIVSGGANAATYAWTPAGNLNDATIANPVATLSTSEAYTVTVTNAAGCTALGTTSVTVAGPVDDGDPCTLDACLNGVVSHTFQDADGDLICDANDPCPNLPFLTNGDPCDDGNVCTISDVVAGCVCAGTFQDTDGDGTCDANDNCPLVVGQQGSPCDDGNPLTIADQLNGSCVCVGQAVDCLGVPNGPDVPGQPCNDNNVCTINDTWSNLCACVGTFQDTDLDGTCDANDGCPNDANKIAPGICGCGVADTDTDGDGLANCIDNCPLVSGVQGSSCTDGNPCTINDVLDANCVCVGTPDPVTAGVTASAATYCTPGAGVTLTATGGATYSWSPAAGLSAVTGSPVTATPAVATTYTVTATNGVGCSDTETISVGVGTTPATPVMSANPGTVCPGSNSQLGAQIGAAPSYCAATATATGCFGDEFLSNVVFGSISNPSGCTYGAPDNSYNNFTAQSTTLAAGSLGNALTATITNLFSGDQMRVWFDWNQDGDFTDLGEEYLPTGAVAVTTNFLVDVPAGAVNGSTRMRVRLTWVGVIPACGSTSFGEVEDYSVVVTGGVSSCAPGITFSWSPATYLDNAAICNPLATAVLAATTYTVTATNASGCFSTNTIAVAVETLDTDGDGTVDCADGCPADPNKIAPGQCGCGVADTDTDGDLTADCNDLCPADPLKTAPGICGCGVSDVDTDTDGTADCNDGCPTDPNKIAPGQCGCGVADTDGDLDGIADCIDNCPAVAGVIGTPCDDGNGGTINDVLNGLCVCEGIVPTCAFNTVLLDLVTDNDGAQTSWDVVNIGTNTAVCTGSGYINNQTVTLDCCLPNGCYELRVFDSMGDGMANGTIGGYVLRAAGAGNKRIIDNSGDGIFTSTSTIANNLGFCVPIGTDAPIAASCDKTNWLPNDVLQATANGAVTGQFGVSNANSGYQFWFFNPDGGYSRRITQTHAAPGPVSGPPANVRSSYLRLNSLVSQPIPFYTNLNVRIRTQVAGVFSEFGPACRFRLDPPCATTQLTTVADPVVSCGATNLTLSSTIYASAVAGASTYQFEFSKSGYLRRISVAARQVALSFVTNPLQNNNCYQVRLRVSFDGGNTFCPFGPSCNITIGTAFCGGSMALEPGSGITTTEEARMNLWPNPNDGSVVNVSLTGFDVTANTVLVEVTDAYGKLVSVRTVPVQDGYMNTTMAFEQDLAPGLYLVNMQVGEKRYTERLVIQ